MKCPFKLSNSETLENMRKIASHSIAASKRGPVQCGSSAWEVPGMVVDGESPALDQ